MIDATSRRRRLPPGAQTATVVMVDGWPVRSLFWPARSDSPGSILLLTGRADFAEKYSETLHDLVDAGWGVATFDWRGQGLSGRIGDDAFKGDAPEGGFDRWLADLGAMTAWFHTVLPPPWFAIGHSMGGHLLLRHLASDDCGFERAVALAPMLGLVARPWGAPIARRLAQLMVWLGRGHRYVAGGGPNLSREPGSPRQLQLTSDPARYVDEGWWIEQKPALALGSSTWGWLAAAFASIDALCKPVGGASRLQRITAPLLVLAPEADTLVDGDSTRAAVASMATATLELVPSAGHELLREASDIRARVLARALDFLHRGA